MRKSISTALTLAAAAALAPSLASAGTNPFGADKLASGYQLGQELPNYDKHEEGKCGEGKCGSKPEGEGKCGEGKCGGDKPAGEGKCGEGKCGGQ